MFSILDWLRQKRAVWKWRNSALGQALEQHTRESFANTKLSSFSDAAKTNIINDFYARVVGLTQVENPFLKFREELATSACAYSELQVLCLKPDEKRSAFYADCPFISAELYMHITECAQHNEEMRKILWSMKGGKELDSVDAVEFLVDVANTRCCVYLYYLNGFNLVRSEFENLQSKDWLRPFVKSMLIWMEDTYRSKIGLPCLLPDEITSLQHSTFMNMVVNGIENPLFEWESTYGMTHSEVTSGSGR